MTESAAQFLRLRRRRCKRTTVCETNKIDHCKSWVVLKLCLADYTPVISCAALVLSKLTNYTPNITLMNLTILQGIEKSLADPQFDHLGPIDIVLGSDISSSIIIPGSAFKFKKFFFQESIFGWVFSGPDNNHPFPNVTIHVANVDNIHNIIGHYNPSVRIIDPVSHTPLMLCICFIHKWRDLRSTPNDRFLRNISSKF